MSSTGSDTRSYTYAELAATLGTGVPSVRNLVRRKRWHKVTGNDKLVRVVVPIEYVDRQRAAAACAAHDPAHDPGHGAAPDGPTHAALQVLQRHIERLEAELDPLRSMPAQVAALRAALDAVRDERDRLLTREHLREQRRWWRRLTASSLRLLARNSCQRSMSRLIAATREAVSPCVLPHPGRPASSGSVTDHPHGLGSRGTSDIIRTRPMIRPSMMATP
jgi:hypothetical protein